MNDLGIRNTNEHNNTKLRRIDKQAQAWAMQCRGLPIADIAEALDESPRNTSRLIAEEAKRRAEEQAIMFEHPDSKLALFHDKIDTIIAHCYVEMGKSHERSLNKSGLANAIIRAIELQAKADGLLVNRIAGSDGGPIQVTAVENREEAINEIRARMKQIDQFSRGNVSDAEEDIIDAEAS